MHFQVFTLVAIFTFLMTLKLSLFVTLTSASVVSFSLSFMSWSCSSPYSVLPFRTLLLLLYTGEMPQRWHIG